MQKYSNEELQVLVSQWGLDRKITINGKISTQTIKFGEEFGELFEADTFPKVKDAIGDMIVVLSMIADLNKTSIMACKELHPRSTILNNIKYSSTDALSIVYGRLCSAVVREKYYDLNVIIQDFVEVLTNIAYTQGTSFNECWNLAYNEIKDRTGTLLENGNFVKD
jgi:hypothetical protein